MPDSEGPSQTSPESDHHTRVYGRMSAVVAAATVGDDAVAFSASGASAIVAGGGEMRCSAVAVASGSPTEVSAETFVVGEVARPGISSSATEVVGLWGAAIVDGASSVVTDAGTAVDFAAGGVGRSHEVSSVSVLW